MSATSLSESASLNSSWLSVGCLRCPAGGLVSSVEALDHQLHQFIAGHVVELLVEDFDFDRTVVTRAIDGLAEPTNLDLAVAHHPAPLQHVRQRNDPIVHMESQYPPARPLDLRVDIRVPPHVID